MNHTITVDIDDKTREYLLSKAKARGVSYTVIISEILKEAADDPFEVDLDLLLADPYQLGIT